MRSLRYIAALIVTAIIILHIAILLIEITPDETSWSPYSSAPRGLSKLASRARSVYIEELPKTMHNETLIILLIKPPGNMCGRRLSYLVANADTSVICAEPYGLLTLQSLLQVLNMTVHYTKLVVEDPGLNAGSKDEPLIAVNVTGTLNKMRLLMIALPNATYMSIQGNECRGIGFTSPTAVLENGTPIPLKPLIYVCVYSSGHKMYLIPSCEVFQNRYLTGNVMKFLEMITANRSVILMVLDRDLGKSVITLLKYYIDKNRSILEYVSMLVLVPLGLALFAYIVVDYATSRRISR